MSRKLVAAADKFTKEQAEQIRSTAEECGFTAFLYQKEEEAIPELKDAEVLFCRTANLPKYAPDLRWCASTNAGVESLLVPGALPNEQCVLTNSAGAYGVTISEHILMMTLCLLRKMPEYQAMIREKYYTLDYLSQRSIHGSRITFMGTGDIGSTTAKIMKAMGAAKIVGLSKSGRRRSDAYDVCDKIDQAGKYLPDTDILILSLPSTPETKGALSRERIACLPKNAIVVNVGRGVTVDQQALMDALNEEKIAGAALDVVTPEPLPKGDPLWDAKNLLLTPHCAGNLALGYTTQRVVDLFLDNFRKYAAGEPMHNIVERSIGY
ncbi:MAG: D-2-hydroxyacid dehydrogenase [Eubacteriales bacterium]|nr:D-2-hydroxyacid dehydrogenase [Eubacteriales bacterium]